MPMFILNMDIRQVLEKYKNHLFCGKTLRGKKKTTTNNSPLEYYIHIQ